MGIRRRYIIGGIVLALVAGYLLYLSFSSSVSYYVTVSEFFDRGTELYDTSIRVAGKIAADPVDWNADDLELRFTITEGEDSMTVLYNGAEPSNFEAGMNILVEGRYGSGGIFRATQLIMKCPSKYEPEE
ncbi:cytochrome c maturation protein CcmE [Chloroflexota bacterium]